MKLDIRVGMQIRLPYRKVATLADIDQHEVTLLYNKQFHTLAKFYFYARLGLKDGQPFLHNFP